MKKSKFVFSAIFLFMGTLLLCGCENYAVSDEINGLFRENALSIEMKVEDSADGFTAERVYESATEYYLKINVSGTYSLRGKAEIKPGNKYRLSFTLKNTDADPVINYSFWKGPVTSLRHYTFKGENGNPPSSETQELYYDWTTFEETFETLEGEDSFLLTLHSADGTFYIKEINIKQLQ